MRTVLESVPPICMPEEVRATPRQPSAKVAARGAFLLQGGDCARPSSRTPSRTSGKHPHPAADGRRAHLRRESPVVKVARIAGQYAKPRSSKHRRPGPDLVPRRHGQRLPGRRGRRIHDPSRLVRAYANASAAMNLVRALTGAGLGRPASRARLEPRVRADLACGRALRGVGVRDRPCAPVHGRLRGAGLEPRVGEHLRLPRGARPRLRTWTPAVAEDPRDPDGDPVLYDLSAHFLWIGERHPRPRRRALRAGRAHRPTRSA